MKKHQWNKLYRNCAINFCFIDIYTIEIRKRCFIYVSQWDYERGYKNEKTNKLEFKIEHWASSETMR